jgi:hypothetical protein
MEGGESSFGSIRYFRVSDLEAILKEEDKSIKDAHARIKKPEPKRRGGWVLVPSEEITKKKKTSK